MLWMRFCCFLAITYYTPRSCSIFFILPCVPERFLHALSSYVFPHPIIMIPVLCLYYCILLLFLLYYSCGSKMRHSPSDIFTVLQKRETKAFIESCKIPSVFNKNNFQSPNMFVGFRVNFEFLQILNYFWVWVLHRSFQLSNTFAGHQSSQPSVFPAISLFSLRLSWKAIKAIA